MFCSNCGDQLPAQARFCPSCGHPVPGATDPERTTAGIERGTLDASAELEDLPTLEPGTGLLVVLRGPNAGSRYLVDRDVTLVGRHPDSHVFLDDVTVSRRHAEIVRRGTELFIRDLGSLNGTYVNGDRVEERVLHTGDELQIGRFKLLYVGAGP